MHGAWHTQLLGGHNAFRSYGAEAKIIMRKTPSLFMTLFTMYLTNTGLTAYADSEASYQSATLSGDQQNTSMSSRQSISGASQENMSFATSASTNQASHENSTESSFEAGGLRVSQQSIRDTGMSAMSRSEPSISGLINGFAVPESRMSVAPVLTNQPTVAGGFFTPVELQPRPKVHIPEMRIVEYHWK